MTAKDLKDVLEIQKQGLETWELGLISCECADLPLRSAVVQFAAITAALPGFKLNANTS